MAAIHTFPAKRSGSRATAQQLRTTTTVGVVDVLDETGALVASSVSVDDLIYGALAAIAAVNPLSTADRLAAYAANTGQASTTHTITWGVSGLAIDDYSLTVEDLPSLYLALFRAGRYEGQALGRRQHAIDQARRY